MPITVCVYTRSVHSVLCVCMTRKRAVYVHRKNLLIPATISWRLFAHFCIRKHAASVALIHAHTNASAGLSDASTTLSLLSRVFPCCKSRPNISSSSCYWAPWAALRSYSRTQASLLQDACMLIMIRKCNMHTYLKRWWNLFYFDEHRL